MKKNFVVCCVLWVWCVATMAQAWDFKPTPIKYRAIENVVDGQKDGLALTYDVLIPETKPKNRGVLLIVSDSWKSREFNALEDEEKLRGQLQTPGEIPAGAVHRHVRQGHGPRSRSCGRSRRSTTPGRTRRRYC
jgi:hypothetical protein